MRHSRNNTNIELQRAFVEAERRENRRIPDDADIAWQPSKRFNNRMKRMIRAQRLCGAELWHLASRCAACLVVVALVVFCATIGTDAVGAPRIEYEYRCVEDEQMDYIFPAHQAPGIPTRLETVFELPMELIPEGYWLEEQEITDHHYYVKYVNDDGRAIRLCQCVTTSCAYSLALYKTTVTDVLVAGYPAKLVVDDRKSDVTWLNEDYFFSLCYTGNACEGDLDADALLQMADALMTRGHAVEY